MRQGLSLAPGIEISYVVKDAKKWEVEALTARVPPEIKEKCFEAGMDDYISRPVRLEELRAVLESYG